MSVVESVEPLTQLLAFITFSRETIVLLIKLPTSKMKTFFRIRFVCILQSMHSLLDVNKHSLRIDTDRPIGSICILDVFRIVSTRVTFRMAKAFESLVLSCNLNFMTIPTELGCICKCLNCVVKVIILQTMHKVFCLWVNPKLVRAIAMKAIPLKETTTKQMTVWVGHPASNICGIC